MGVTETIDNMLTYIYANSNNSQTVLSIFYDPKNAFDTIDNSILFCKLWGTGVKGFCLNLLKNYLDG